jgi:hypothetical protein
MMMGRVLEMQGEASIYCVILINALETQVRLLLVTREELVFNGTLSEWISILGEFIPGK